jgi:hypothetical protein
LKKGIAHRVAANTEGVVSGGYLASLSGAMKQGWIPDTLLAIGIALLLGFVLILPHMRKIRTALPSLNEPVTADLRLRLSDPVLLSAIRIRVLLAAGIAYLMAAKSPFMPSLIDLTAAFIVGVFSRFLYCELARLAPHNRQLRETQNVIRAVNCMARGPEPSAFCNEVIVPNPSASSSMFGTS